MDEAGNHRSQQTNIGTENQILHIVIHKWELNNERTYEHRERNIIPWGLSGGGELGAG